MNTATVRADGTGTLTLNGHTTTVHHPTVAAAQEALMLLVAEEATRTAAPVQVTATDPEGTLTLSVDPTGDVTTLPTPTTAPAPTTTAPAAAHTPAPATSSAPTTSRRSTTTNQPVIPAPATPLKPVESRSFLRDSQTSPPPPTGLTALLAKLGFTARADEAAAIWSDERAVSQHWPGPRTIAVLNGKGGAGKTPATILLSAILARHGGGGVLAWDCNITRGTLGWRTEQGPHASTVLDLLPHAEAFLAPGAQSADLAAYTHHQTADKFDVLRSNPLLLSTEQELTPAQLDLLHAALTRYYRLVIMDSGNDEGAALWRRMIDHADQIVIATTTRRDHAEAGRLLLDALRGRDDHSATLARNAVVIVSQADREEAQASEIANAFRDLARDVVTIPYDPAMRQQWLRHDTLHPTTQRAYLRAAAATTTTL